MFSIIRLFENTLPNTLDTTIKWFNEDLTFVVTGDIEAEWCMGEGLLAVRTQRGRFNEVSGAVGLSISWPCTERTRSRDYLTNPQPQGERNFGMCCIGSESRDLGHAARGYPAATPPSPSDTPGRTRRTVASVELYSTNSKSAQCP